MLQLFRTNQPYVIPFLAIILLLVRAITFWQIPETPVYQSGVLGDFVYSLVGTSGLIPQIVAFCLVFIQALLTNRTCNEYQLAPENSYYPALFFILLSSFLPSMQTLSPALLGNTFFLIAINETFRSYKNIQTADSIFNVGFWIAIGSLFYWSYGVFVIWGVIGISLLRNFRIEETLILVLGFVVPYFLVAVYFFWINAFPFFIKKEIYEHLGFLSFQLIPTWQNLLTLVFWGIAILYSFFDAGSFFEKTSIYAQRNIQLLFWMFALFALSLFAQNKIGMEHLLIIIIPVSIFLASVFLIVRKAMYAEFAFITICIVTLVFQYEKVLLDILEK
jgi:Family of unknown function (DUF6427)